MYIFNVPKNSSHAPVGCWIKKKQLARAKKNVEFNAYVGLEKPVSDPQPQQLSISYAVLTEKFLPPYVAHFFF